MEIILYHFYQHLAGDVCFTVSLPPVFIQIPKPGTLQLTNLTVPGLDLIMNVAHVVPQSPDIVELQFTLTTLLHLLPLGVVSLDVTKSNFVGWEVFATLFLWRIQSLVCPHPPPPPPPPPPPSPLSPRCRSSTCWD